MQSNNSITVIYIDSVKSQKEQISNILKSAYDKRILYNARGIIRVYSDENREELISLINSGVNIKRILLEGEPQGLDQYGIPVYNCSLVG